MYYYIYKMTDPNTGEFYIGRRSSSIEPELDITYRGSMSTWKKEENFDKNILIKEILVKDIETMEELCELEPIMIESVIKDPLNKNAHIPNKGFYIIGPRSEETKKKMSDANKGSKNPFYGKSHTKKSLAILSKKNQGENNPMYGKMQTEEGRKRISESNKKADHPNNNREREKNPFHGKTHSDENKKRWSENRSGSKNPRARRCIAEGIEYGSTKDASIALGIAPSTVRQRINSDKWVDFYYLSDI